MSGIKTFGPLMVGRKDTGLFWNRQAASLLMKVAGVTIATMTASGGIVFATNPSFADDILPSVDATYDLGSGSYRFQDLFLSRYLKSTPGNALTAFATGGQTSATALAKRLNFISTCATAADSVKLPVSVAGMDIFVWNGGAAAAQVFGAGTDTINGVATATGVPLPVGQGAWFICNAAGTWLAPGLTTSPLPSADNLYDLGSASFQYRDAYLSRNLIMSAGYVRGSVGNALTAFATGGQASALALTKQFNYISVCATAGDSVRLPVSAAGMSIFIWNGGAAVAQVFGAGTDTINGVATGTGVPLPAASGAWFNCNVAGTWLSPGRTAVLPEGSYNTETNTTSFTTTGAKFAGAGNVVLNITGTLGSGQNVTSPTAAQIVAAIPNAFVGQTYRLRIQNTSSANFAWTLLAGSGVTLNGATQTIAQNTYRDYLVTLTSLTAVALQSLGQVIVGAV